MYSRPNAHFIVNSQNMIRNFCIIGKCDEAVGTHTRDSYNLSTLSVSNRGGRIPVGVLFRTHHEHAFQRCFLEGHTIRSSGMGMMNMPPEARYLDCWARISSAKFHVSNRT